MKIAKLFTLIVFIIFSSSYYQLKAQCTDTEDIETFNHDGKKISEFQLNQVGTQKINLTGLNSGVFLAQFITIDGKIEYTKIIK